MSAPATYKLRMLKPSAIRQYGGKPDHCTGRNYTKLEVRFDGEVEEEFALVTCKQGLVQEYS